MKVKITKFIFILISAIFYLGAAPVSSVAQMEVRPERTYDVQHYLIRTDIDRKSKSISGDTTITLKPLKNGFESVRLDAVGLRFSSVTLEPGSKTLQFKTTETAVTISLDRSYNADELIKIRFRYRATPKKAINFVDRYIKNGRVVRPEQIWTQGEPEEIRHWFPAYDFPDDKATSEQILTVEKGEMAIANGKLLKITDNPDGTRTFHFKMSDPHPTYLTSFVIGKYEKIEDRYRDIPLGFYVYPNRTQLVARSFGRTKDMLRIFEELTGISYPFNKYDQTIVGNMYFGGMENITATTMSDIEILAGINVDDLIAHELAHSWFGNLVTCKNWSELWLNEGFATFMEAAFREKQNGRSDYLQKIKSDARQFMIEDAYSSNKHGLFNRTADPENDSTMFDTTTYQKGGVVIHMLRETIGEKAFWTGLNNYLERHKFDTVETADLQRALEETAGTKLDWFFKQWVYGTGFPRLSVAPTFNSRTGRLNLIITQTQKIDEGLTPSVFVLPLEVRIITSGGEQKAILNLRQRVQAFSIDLPRGEKPREIIFDEDDKIPLKIIRTARVRTISSDR